MSFGVSGRLDWKFVVVKLNKPSPFTVGQRSRCENQVKRRHSALQIGFRGALSQTSTIFNIPATTAFKQFRI